MKKFVIGIAAIVLSACSMDGMAKKMVPEKILANHASYIDLLLEGNTSDLAAALNVNENDTDKYNTILTLINAVPDGGEIRRDYVGVNSASSVSTETGKTRNISLVTEVQTEGGFLLVTTNYALNAKGECCALKGINAEGSDTSPVRAGMVKAMKMAKFIGVLFLLFILSLIVLLVRRSRRRKTA